MPTTIPPGRLAEALSALGSAHMCDRTALRLRIQQVATDVLGLRNVRLVESIADAVADELYLPLCDDLGLVCEKHHNTSDELLTAFAAVAGNMLRQSAHCELTMGEYSAVLTRLDEVRRDLDSAHRGEWIATERLRIAQDLHDRAAQTLFGLGLTADWLLAHVDAGDPLHGDLERLKAMAATGMRQVREAIFSLTSPPVEPEQFASAVRALVHDVENAGIKGDLRVWGDVAHLTPDVTDALYQIIREALLNVRRHSQATFVMVSVRIEPDRVTAVVQDDGTGLPAVIADTYRKNGSHLGLRGMEGRAERLGGTFALAPGDECGLIVTVTIPLKGAACHD